MLCDYPKRRLTSPHVVLGPINSVEGGVRSTQFKDPFDRNQDHLVRRSKIFLKGSKFRLSSNPDVKRGCNLESRLRAFMFSQG